MGDLFKIISVSATEEGCVHRVWIDRSHEVFQGHFPGQPVLPGVCALSIIKTGIGEFLGKKMMFSSVKECKFVGAVDPRTDEYLTLASSLKETPEGVEVRCTMGTEEKTTIKLRALLTAR